jgi:hypothetical protein
MCCIFLGAIFWNEHRREQCLSEKEYVEYEIGKIFEYRLVRFRLGFQQLGTISCSIENYTLACKP